jgi:hypothetical protein
MFSYEEKVIQSYLQNAHLAFQNDIVHAVAIDSQFETRDTCKLIDNFKNAKAQIHDVDPLTRDNRKSHASYEARQSLDSLDFVTRNRISDDNFEEIMHAIRRHRKPGYWDNMARRTVFESARYDVPMDVTAESLMEKEKVYRSAVKEMYLNLYDEILGPIVDSFDDAHRSKGGSCITKERQGHTEGCDEVLGTAVDSSHDANNIYLWRRVLDYDGYNDNW